MNQNSENAAVGAYFQKEVTKWFESHYKKHFEEEKKLSIGYSRKKAHKFDIVSDDNTIAIECKCYTWTDSGNVPTAKLGTANEAVFYLSFLPETCEKYLVFKKDKHPKHKRDETLAEYYVRTNGHLLGSTNVAEYDLETGSFRVIEQ